MPASAKAQSSLGHSTTAATTTLREHDHSVRTTASRKQYDRGGRLKKEPTIPETDMPFNEHTMPNKEQLQKASALTVISQAGVRVPFGNLFKDRKTIVVFIRHFWYVA